MKLRRHRRVAQEAWFRLRSGLRHQVPARAAGVASICRVSKPLHRLSSRL